MCNGDIICLRQMQDCLTGRCKLLQLEKKAGILSNDDTTHKALETLTMIELYWLKYPSIIMWKLVRIWLHAHQVDYAIYSIEEKDLGSCSERHNEQLLCTGRSARQAQTTEHGVVAVGDYKCARWICCLTWSWSGVIAIWAFIRIVWWNFIFYSGYRSQ